MTKIKINGTYKKLVRYCEYNRNNEWICVHGIFTEYNANVWEIWKRENLTYLKRQKAWKLETFCGSWANMCDNWEKLTGEIIKYEK